MYLGQSCTSLMLLMSRSASGFCCPFSTPIPEFPSCRNQSAGGKPERWEWWEHPILALGLHQSFHFTSLSITLTAQLWYLSKCFTMAEKFLACYRWKDWDLDFTSPVLRKPGVSCGRLDMSQTSLSAQILHRICNLPVLQSTYKQTEKYQLPVSQNQSKDVM